MKKITVFAALAAALMLGACNVNINVNPKAPTDAPAPSESAAETVILFTNDAHCHVNDGIGYSGLAAYKDEMEKTGADVLLVDDGDEVQGGSIGTLTKGDSIVSMMNDVGYDIAIPGNHEFDYGMDRYLELTKKMDFPVICANLINLRTGKPVFEPYVIKEAGGRKIAFVGVTTPTTITSTAPKYFQDENGEYLYGFCQGDGGNRLYETVQNAVGSAKEDGADIIVLIAHLGIDDADSPYMSTDVISHTSGIDVVLDGHSHSTVEMEKVKNKDGKNVILSQTGCFMAAIGKLTIDAAGNMKTELITDYDTKDQKVQSEIDEEEASYNEKLQEVIGSTGFDLMSTHEDGKTWLVRNNETNMGDFVADAYRYATGAQIAIINGGGVRANIMKGDVTYGDLLNVNPFSNALCIRKVTGEELSDALDYSVGFFPDDFGGFLQVSGITFDVDYDVKSQVKLDDNKMFAGFAGDDRRVSNIMVGDEPLDPSKEYEVASIEYILFNQGNGYSMFTGDRVELDGYIEDIDALIQYLDSMKGKVSEEYAEVSGRERIHVKDQKEDAK